MSTARPISWIRVTLVAIPCTLVLAGLFWIFAGRHVPAHRARLYQDPISTIQSIRLNQGNYSSLVDHDVAITDSATIHEIMTALRTAKKYSPNHPATRWTCELTISSSSGESYVGVNESLGQDTLLHSATSPHGGFIFDTRRSSTLGHILEQAAARGK